MRHANDQNDVGIRKVHVSMRNELLWRRRRESVTTLSKIFTAQHNDITGDTQVLPV